MVDWDRAEGAVVDSPLQREMRAALTPTEWVVPAGQLVPGLVALIEERIGDASSHIFERPSDSPLMIDRIALGDVLACETYFVTEDAEPFEYDVKRARGQVAFTTIRRWYLRDPSPSDADELDLEAMVRAVIADESEAPGKLGEFLLNLSPGSRADLVGEAANVAYSFVEAWPSDFRPSPFRNHWLLAARLLQRRLALRYRVSFRFGQPRRSGSDLVARAVLFDVRPGRPFEDEERANRWYAALLETISVGVPPARVVTWYAEGQEVVFDDIDLPRLEAAARRAGDGVRRIVELHSQGREPTREPGWRCNYCSHLDTCAPGMAYRTNR